MRPTKPESARVFEFIAEPCPGVYFVYRDDRLFYVGSSGNVFARVTSAAHPKIEPGDRIRVELTPTVNGARHLERQAIKQFNPPGNDKLPSPNRLPKHRTSSHLQK